MQGQDPAAFLGVSQSLTGRGWMLRPHDERLALAIAEQHDLAEVVGRVLAGRGITIETAADFLKPSLRNSLPDPSVFEDMDKAADRIARAIRDGEKIAVFGDYDVDGATSSALLARFFRALGRDLTVYIPDRLQEGYGPNAPALLKLRRDGASLAITVDCGTLSYAPLEAAAEAGLDIIVIDHHKAEVELPIAQAIVNPNRLDDTSGQGQLAAVGVAFMLAVAINRALRAAGYFQAGRAEPNLMAVLDLVALGTVCDVVPLTGVNRALVAQGLKVMGERRNPGIAALSDVGGVSEAPRAYHLGFVLGPRVNAGGRVGEAGLGARLLATEDGHEARQIAERLDGYNADRKTIEKAVQDAAMAQVLEREAAGTLGPVITVTGEGWHPGVIGIVAGRIKDRFQRPTAVIAVEGDIAKGSARSIPGVDIGSAMLEAQRKGLLVNGGGHAMAAGLTVRTGQIEALDAFLQEALADQVAMARTSRRLKLDGAVTIGGATPDLLGSLEAVGPFGTGNPEPRFAIENVRVVAADVVGENHLRAFVTGGDGGRMKVMAFRQVGEPLGDALLHGIGRRFHLAGKLKLDDWGATPKTELFLDDAATVDG